MWIRAWSWIWETRTCHRNKISVACSLCVAHLLTLTVFSSSHWNFIACSHHFQALPHSWLCIYWLVNPSPITQSGESEETCSCGISALVLSARSSPSSPTPFTYNLSHPRLGFSHWPVGRGEAASMHTLLWLVTQSARCLGWIFHFY